MDQLTIFDLIEPKKENKKEVRRITREQAKDFILNKHYAKRWGPTTYIYGLFENNKLLGVCTIGKPASYTLCEGVLGKEYKAHVWELNRLCVIDGLPKNTLSYFVGQVLKDLKKYNLVLVSFADTNANHHGYIYQATNWLYTGETKQMKDMYIPNGKHSRTAWKREEFNKFSHLKRIRSVKHRYIYFACDKKHKKDFLKLLKYKTFPYPKGDNKRYVLGERMKYKVLNTITGEEWYE